MRNFVIIFPRVYIISYADGNLCSFNARDLTKKSPILIAMLLIILISVCAILIYKALTKSYNYWNKRDIIHEKPWPLFGNLAPVICQKESMTEFLQRVYNKYPQERYVGLYQFLLPSLMIRDPDLIKVIAVKEFDTFPEHTAFASEEADPIWSNTLFAMPGGVQWRDLRAVLSPAFTSSKLRSMFGLIVDCAKQFTNHMENPAGFITLEMKDTFTKVTNDIIATTAFGVSCDSLKDPDNDIFVMGKGASDLTGLVPSLMFFIAAISPSLTKFLKVRFISKKHTDFFRKIIKQTVTVREEKGIIRHDMIHLLMEARKGRLRYEKNGTQDTSLADELQSEPTSIIKHHKAIITDDVMTAQAVVFFLAGFDTVSTAMSYTAYELALNPDIQERLFREVDQTLETCGGRVTYEGLMSMKYLDMVVSEALRKWPPFAIIDRKVVKSFTIEPKLPHEKPLTIDNHVVCQIPTYALHRDPNFYPNPEKFDPERFSDQNKQNIKPFTYLPFGAGPRNCIGSRFALLEVKVVVFHILSKFKIVPVEKTPVPLVLSRSNVNPIPDEGFWLGLKPRKLSNSY